eukprot:CAMPEP_0181482296 /NCGR_PEP_ID=MMETSP1110-20121109/44767_1 /TAXON_ID=174948 /ORGANISM="Symbiodinium sp., Strain CCMP421" /LENGTH=64 /DNA_ID=CAMNT_0023607841 /DNA_START=44 /DNA_END=238 /DNA_ORIENTATION=-
MSHHILRCVIPGLALKWACLTGGPFRAARSLAVARKRDKCVETSRTFRTCRVLDGFPNSAGFAA